jgi:hypothetical protein
MKPDINIGILSCSIRLVDLVFKNVSAKMLNDENFDLYIKYPFYYGVIPHINSH